MSAKREPNLETPSPANYYPFDYKAKAKITSGEIHADEWHQPNFSLTEKLENIRKPIIEIGGPSDEGYYFLDGVKLLNKPIITNVSEQPASQQYPDVQNLADMVDELVDGRHTPYEDESIGMVMAAHIDIADEALLDDTTKDKRELYNKFREAAISENQAVASGKLSLSQILHSLRLKIARETWRILEPGGLFLTDCHSEVHDLEAIRRLGFEPVAMLAMTDDPEDTRYDVVFQKPA